MRRSPILLLCLSVLVWWSCDEKPTPGPSQTQYTLTVAASPSNGGSITKSSNQTQFASGTSVTLTASPAAGYQFTGWQGDASGTGNPLTVVMDRNRSVTAVFTTTSSTPQIQRSPSSLSFSATVGGASPAAQTVSITNSGGGTLSGLGTSISYSSGAGWLAASLNTTTAPATLTVTATTGALAVGTYAATISITSGVASNSPQTVTVTFTVSSASTPRIQLSTSSLTFSAAAGGASPSAQTVSITNGGGGTLSGLGTSISYSSGAGWLAASLSSTTAPATLTVTATTGALASGSYNATVSITSGVAGNSPQTVAVTFNLSYTPPTRPAPGLSAPATATTGTAYTVTMTYSSWPTLGSTSDRLELEESTSPTSGFQRINNSTWGQHPSSFPTSITKTQAGTYYYRARAYVVDGFTPYSDVASVAVTAAARSITLSNQMVARFLPDIVQVKVSTTPPSGYFTSADRMTIDGRCWNLPGESIVIGQSRRFDITEGSNYYVYIGLGRWEADATGLVCGLSFPWWKRTYTTDTNWNNWYVYAVVVVNSHQSGDWVWTINGDYTLDTLYVRPAGSTAVKFSVSQSTPIR